MDGVGEGQCPKGQLSLGFVTMSLSSWGLASQRCSYHFPAVLTYTLAEMTPGLVTEGSRHMCILPMKPEQNTLLHCALMCTDLSFMHPELLEMSPRLISAKVFVYKLKNAGMARTDIDSFEVLNLSYIRTCPKPRDRCPLSPQLLQHNSS